MSRAVNGSRSPLRTGVLVLLSLIWLIPTYLAVVNAMTPAKDYDGTPRWLPKSFGIVANIGDALEQADFGQTVVNSLIYSVVCGAAAVLIALLAAFALVITPVRRPTLWFWAIYSGSLLPLQVFARPMFLAAADTNLYDTRLGLGIVYVAICIPFAFFVVRNYLTTVPVEITEAARLDGAAWWRVLVSVHVPLARPAMAAAFVFQFIWVWNELFFGQILTLSADTQPVMTALAGLQGNRSAITPPVVLAAALAVSVPTVVLFFSFQRLFVASLRTGA